MSHKALTLLWHLDECAEAVAEYIENLDMDKFLADRKTQDAVAYRLLITGEALTRMSKEAPEVAARIPERGQAIGLRNYLAHEYDRVDLMTVWDTVVDDLPELHRTVESLISELDPPAAATSAESGPC